MTLRQITVCGRNRSFKRTVDLGVSISQKCNKSLESSSNMPNLTPTVNFMNGERALTGRASLFMAAQAGAVALPVCHSRIIKYNKAWS